MKRNKQAGFGLIEIMIALAVITFSFLGVISFFIASREASFKTVRKTEATSLAEETMEAVRNLRDESWAANIATLTAGTTYYPNISGSKWILQTTNPNTNSFYTKKVVLSNVTRDVNANIASSGSNDANTKKVVSTVSWSEGGSTKNVVLTTYITNFLGN